MGMKQSTSRRVLIGVGVIVLIVLVMVIVSSAGPQTPQRPGPQQPAVNDQPTKPPTPLKPNVTVSPDEPQIIILEPSDGAFVTPLVSLRLGAANFLIPLREVVIHIAIDAACVAPGEIIPEDEIYRRFDQGLFQAPALTLSAGPHRLCIQASSTNDIALDGAGMVRVIDVTVEIPPTASE
jgi:hypothetical protein